MYGKFFASTFTGSMFGAGPDVFAVWGYVIANTMDSTVELNPALLAAILGTTVERVQTAVAFLCAPDSLSRSPEENGSRLIHEGGFQYRVVNHAHYRAMRNSEDRRAYNREAKRKQRSSHVKPNVNDMSNMSAMVSRGQPRSAHTEAETETETETKNTLDHLTVIDRAFEEFWAIYPRKIGKAAAKRAWKKLRPSETMRQTILAAVRQQTPSEQWRAEGGRFVPHPATWLNQGRWDDELPHFVDELAQYRPMGA